jgi:hypothetical protein
MLQIVGTLFEFSAVRVLALSKILVAVKAVLLPASAPVLLNV